MKFISQIFFHTVCRERPEFFLIGIDSVVLGFEINKAVHRSDSFFQLHEAMICSLFIVLGLAFNHEVGNYNFIIEKSFS